MLTNRHHSNLRFGGKIVLSVVVSLVLPLAGLAATDKQVMRGKQVFEKATCIVCHPGGGNNLNPYKPLKGPAFAKEFVSDASLVKVIREGIKGTSMPKFNQARLSDADLKDLIAYVRSLTPRTGK